MKIVKLSYDDVKKYKDYIIKYLEDALKESFIEYEDDYIVKLYVNMCEFCKDGSAIIYGAVEDNKLYGFIWGYLINNNRIHITYFIVNNKIRSKGLGQKLISNIYDYAYANNIDCIELMASIANKNTIKFYEKQGFEIERVKMIKNLLMDNQEKKGTNYEI